MTKEVWSTESSLPVNLRVTLAGVRGQAEAVLGVAGGCVEVGVGGQGGEHGPGAVEQLHLELAVRQTIAPIFQEGPLRAVGGASDGRTVGGRGVLASTEPA